MKKKIAAVLLCVALLLTISFNVSAYQVLPVTDEQIFPITDGITVNVSENGNTAIAEFGISSNSDMLPLAATAIPIGYLDIVSVTEINGWAYQSDIPNTALEVHIYITNVSNGSQVVYSTMANIYRGDLDAAGYGNGCHAFQWNMNWKSFVPGTYRVKAYAIGTHGVNPQLTNTKNFTVRNVQYNVEYITPSYVEGWIWKPDAPNEPLAVHIYVYRSNGDLYSIHTCVADCYRGDLQNAGYGDGCHGFRCYINFASMLEEKFTIDFHYIDDSGYYPTFHQGYYDNRMPITLLGMKDTKGIDHSTWMWDNDVATYCENIGCTKLKRFSYADATNSHYSYSRFIRESSYCAIATHGQKTGIQWSMRQIYNNHRDCQNEYCTTCYGMYTTTMYLQELPNNYFSKTRCVVTTACCTAEGGEMDTTNFVNVLHSKGVKTVVGFESETWFLYNITSLQTIPTRGSFKWLVKFTELLGEGYTVESAAENAYNITLAANLSAENYTQFDLDNNLIPENIRRERILCGLHTCCIVGDKSQIVKH